MASIIHFAPMPLSTYGAGYPRFYGILVLILLGVLGLLMVSTIRYTSFKTVATGRTNIYIVLLIAALGMFIWFYSEYALLVLGVLYVSHGVLWYLLGILSPRRKQEEPQVAVEES